jgi:hypothetical protein
MHSYAMRWLSAAQASKSTHREGQQKNCDQQPKFVRIQAFMPVI